VSNSLVTLLRGLSLDQWNHKTIAGTWAVRDVVAHLLDSTLRRLSFHRDGMTPPSPPRAITSERDFVNFINDLNALWVTAAKRLSPPILTGLYARAASEAADWFEALSLDAHALFPVSWAGEHASSGWFDIGREFTELWHHQQQIRIAVDAPALTDPRYLAAVIDVALRGLPHAFRDVAAEPGHTAVVDISGASGGQWTLSSDGQRWSLFRGEPATATTRIRLTDDTAWQVLFNALSETDAERAVHVDGSIELGRAFLRSRSVIV
jgi:uncharacterized protein (TIGR03083 family)